MKYFIFPILISTSLFLYSCSSSEETTKDSNTADSVYVFDEIPADTIEVKKPDEPIIFLPQETHKYYIVQIGAFTTKEKAEDFAAASREKLKKDIIVIYSNDNNLYVVQLTDLFSTRTEAEKVRNELWKTKTYQDAWILTVIK